MTELASLDEFRRLGSPQAVESVFDNALKLFALVHLPWRTAAEDENANRRRIHWRSLDRLEDAQYIMVFRDDELSPQDVHFGIYDISISSTSQVPHLKQLSNSELVKLYEYRRNARNLAVKIMNIAVATFKKQNPAPDLP